MQQHMVPDLDYFSNSKHLKDEKPLLGRRDSNSSISNNNSKIIIPKTIIHTPNNNQPGF